ncbi:unnamed protein product [Staurois parvus]|uniref:Uncharacterized protein n=1 Tax=Staurois parvus TaxID=386267 RepID=A0ABN9GIW8_9NEOB|nr:unnamed protein product [Staurois parvus]
MYTHAQRHMYTHTHVQYIHYRNTQTHVHTHRHMYIHTHVRKYTQTRTHVHAHRHQYTHTHTCTHTHTPPIKRCSTLLFTHRAGYCTLGGSREHSTHCFLCFHCAQLLSSLTAPSANDRSGLSSEPAQQDGPGGTHSPPP